MKKMLYYAVNGSGQGCVFTDMPQRDHKRKVWVGDMDGMYSCLVMQFESEGLELPPIKWSDDPVVINVDVSVCSERHP